MAYSLEVIKLLHGLCLCLVSYINVRFHSLIIVMPSPFHYNMWRYAYGQCIADESSSSCMCSDKFIFGAYDVNTIVSFVVRLSDRFIYFGNLA